ncbi:MAG: TRAP transporter [Desulfobacterales bacterium RIFOXYA12_FULL_46_15]|nr:MAG: TRAP transporter [Desulfobacula sp. GWF2_41_7]OGR23776.1 MAG: TRAP transporter [Desulfobacterales bacterium RIFOXYA12_FULL_46_15]
MNRFTKCLLVLVMALFLGFPAIGTSEEVKLTNPATLSWVAGGVGGGWYVQAGGIAAMISEKEPKLILKVIPGGGLVNPVRISNGTEDIGWGITFVDKMAYSGMEPLFEKPNPNVRSLGGIFGTYYVHIMAAQDQGIQSLSDIEDKIKAGKAIKIAIPMKGTSDLPLIENILQSNNIFETEIKKAGGKVFQANYADMVNLYQDRHVDIIATHLALPASAITEMRVSRPGKLLNIPDQCIDSLSKTLGTLPKSSEMHIIPKGTYKDQSDDVSTVTSTGELLVGSHVKDEVAYTITKILCQNIEELYKINNANKTFIPEKGWVNVAVPLHPGAEKYYKEAGYMK